MGMKDRTIDWLIQECRCSASCAVIALGHAKGDVFVARDMLQNGLFSAKCEREFREGN